MEEQFELHGLPGTQAEAELATLYARYAARRAAGAVSWETDLQAWGVYRYAEVKRVCMDWETFSSERATLREGPHRNLLDMDPPRHAALRRVLAKEFTPGTIARLEPRIRAITDELLAAALARGRFDVVADFAHPLPVTVIAEMLGVPASERPRYRRWAAAILAGEFAGRRQGTAPTPEAVAARAEMNAWFAEECRRPGRADQDDLLGALLSGRADGEPLTEAEVLAFCSLLLMAGHVTTVNLIANATFCLLRYPDQLALVERDRALVVDAVEEVLRFVGPAQDVVRVAAKPVTLGGIDIAEGQRVVAWLASASRDPRMFIDPDRFDVQRRPNPHLAFGLGVHFCLGAPLARLEARVALDALLDPLTRLRPCDADPPRLDADGTLLGISRLVLEGV
ncbi:MAG: cytochrome P450 [Pseudomonadota bacterium]|nr:cytochrome P450 [Pseudomonadota bacterium]